MVSVELTTDSPYGLCGTTDSPYGLCGRTDSPYGLCGRNATLKLNGVNTG